MEGPWNMSDMSLLWRVPRKLLRCRWAPRVAMAALPPLRWCLTRPHLGVLNGSAGRFQEDWRWVWKFLEICPSCCNEVFILCQLLRMSFLFYNWVELAVSGSAQPSSMSLVRSQKASRRKAGDLSRIFCVQGHALLYSGCSCSGPGVSLAIANMQPAGTSGSDVGSNLAGHDCRNTVGRTTWVWCLKAKRFTFFSISIASWGCFRRNHGWRSRCLLSLLVPGWMGGHHGVGLCGVPSRRRDGCR